ncbi:sulfotransferase family protein [Pseudomonas sp. OTU5201]|uniref:sulfotransferase family protein n=1 Tax=Pseudomonas sp. OTU5201 TaxID=3043850 RepID=UPI00313D1670
MIRGMNGGKTRVLVVLGMHRSGTSLLSAGLEVFGVDFGDNLIPPREDNPRGYWEDARLVALNDEILAACGFASGDVGLDLERMMTPHLLDEFVLRAMGLLEELSVGKCLIGIKDPRMPRLMRLWQTAFDRLELQVDFVVAVRHPLSVAKSLARRDKLSQGKSFLLWYEHSCRAMQWSRKRGAILVDYDRFLSSPASELARLGRRLSLPMDTVARDRFIAEVLDVGLRHSMHDRGDLVRAKAGFDALLDVFRVMAGLAADRFDHSPEWDGLELEFTRSQPLLAFAGQLDQELWRSSTHFNAERQRFHDTETALREEVRRTVAIMQQCEVARLGLAGELAAVQETHVTLQANLAAQAGELRKVRAERDRAEQQLNALLASRSWRFTHLFRLMSQNLRRLVGS